MTGKTKRNVRPATAKDIRDFYGGASPRTVRAWVLEQDNEVLGLAGYYILGGKALVFSDAKPGIPKMTIWRQSLAFMRKLTLPARCIACDGSGPFLERLGWVHIGPSEAGEIYEWQA